MTFILLQRTTCPKHRSLFPKKVPQNTKTRPLMDDYEAKSGRVEGSLAPSGAKGCSRMKTWSKHRGLELVWLFGCFFLLSIPGIHTRSKISEDSKLFPSLDVYHCGRFRLISVVWPLLRSMMACLLMFAKFCNLYVQLARHVENETGNYPLLSHKKDMQSNVSMTLFGFLQIQTVYSICIEYIMVHLRPWLNITFVGKIYGSIQYLHFINIYRNMIKYSFASKGLCNSLDL